MKYRRLLRSMLIVWILLISVQSGFAQKDIVTGRVLDQLNEPLAGAVVVVKSTKKNTTTDVDGKFTIEAKPGDLIDITLLGFQPLAVSVPASKTLNVTMQEATVNLEEFVIVGYSMVKKSDLTGSVQAINSQEIMKGMPVSLEQGMQGRLTGVNVVKSDGAPGGGISVQIRGTNSFMGSTEPLYVIDGVPLTVSNDDQTTNFDSNEVVSQNALSFLDPAEIESIEVLKDASAVAIYGSRGSNGVVMITTKSGKRGSSKINFSSSMTISNVAKKLRTLSGQEYAEYRNESFINTQLINNGSYNPMSIPYLGANNSSGHYIKGPSDFHDDPYYWQNQIFKTGISQNYSLNYSGGTEKGDYSVGVSYLSQEGTVINSDYSRMSVNIKTNQQLKPWLKLGASVNYSFSDASRVKAATSNKNNGDEGVIRSAMYYPPVHMMEDEPGYEEYQLVSNPIQYANALNSIKSHNIYTSNYMNATLAEGLIFRTVFAYKTSINFTNRYFDRNLYEGRAVSGLSQAGDNTSQNLTWDNLLMYNRTFKKHSINASIGTSWEDYSYYNKKISTQGFIIDSTQGWILDDGTTPLVPSSDKRDARLFSVIARGSYQYDKRYLATVTMRRDASSKFAANNKVAYFPSIGLGWNTSEESFIKDIKKINEIKVRYSYGASGNSGISSYGSLPLYYSVNYPFGSTISSGYAMKSTNPGNPDLKWETTYQHDLGVEVKLFNRLTLEFDLYAKNTKDLIQAREFAPSSGMNSVLTNIGEVYNRGFEITAGYDVIKSKDMNLRIGGNFAMNRNKIVSLGGSEAIYPNQLWNSLRPFILEDGRPIGQLYGYIEDGIWNSREEVINSAQFQAQYPGYTVNDNVAATETIIKKSWVGEIRIKDKDGDHIITDADQDYIGNVNPDFIYAINASFDYKNFDLSVLFNGVYGNDIINMASLRNYNIGQTRNIPLDVLESAWRPGQGGTGPKLYTTDDRTVYFSRRYIEDGSYLKLRNITIGYTLKRLIKEISHVRIFASANNVFTITDYTGYDPEVNSFGSQASSRGVDAGGYPQSKEFLFGINLTF